MSNMCHISYIVFQNWAVFLQNACSTESSVKPLVKNLTLAYDSEPCCTAGAKFCKPEDLTVTFFILCRRKHSGRRAAAQPAEEEKWSARMELDIYFLRSCAGFLSLTAGESLGARQKMHKSKMQSKSNERQQHFLSSFFFFLLLSSSSGLRHAFGNITPFPDNFAAWLSSGAEHFHTPVSRHLF